MKISNNKKAIQLYINKLELSDIFNEGLLNDFSLHSFNTHEVLFNAEDKLEVLYLLLEGKVGVVPSSEDGKLSLLDIVIASDVIGDIEYFNNDNYYYQVIALTPCTLLAIPVNSIESYFKNNAKFYKYLCENLAQKMKRTSLKYSRALLYPLKNRLARYLLDLAQIHGIKIPDVQNTHTADYFGISLRHLRRVLSEMEQTDIILRKGATVAIVSMSKLQELASYK